MPIKRGVARRAVRFAAPSVYEVVRNAGAYYAFMVYEASMSEPRDHNATATPRSDAGSTPPAATDSPSTPNSPGEAKSGVPHEVGGRAGPEPTRYGDWEKNGRCIDF